MDIATTELPHYLWELHRSGETGLLMIFTDTQVATGGFEAGRLAQFLFHGKTGIQAINAFAKRLRGDAAIRLRLQFRPGPVGAQQQNLPTFDLFCEMIEQAVNPAPDAATGRTDYRHTVPLTDPMKPVIREVVGVFFGTEGERICDDALGRASTLRSAFLMLSGAAEDQQTAQDLFTALRERLRPLVSEHLPD